jgi:O-antigen/teichoic acid export membrane protein
VRLTRNFIAGITSSLWNALIGLAVVPLYIDHLGIEAFGLIGFFATTQAMLSLLDLGLAATLNREIARCSASDEIQNGRNLLHTFSIIYGATAAIIALLVITLAPFIANYWLLSKTISQDILTHAVALIGLVIACRWPIGLYAGALMGMQRIDITACTSITMVTIGNLGAVGILDLVSPTIEAFFIWQAIIAVVHAAILRTYAWRVIGRNKISNFDYDSLRRLWQYTLSMSGVAVSGVILIQLDKVILSKMLSLGDFGRYTLAGTLASGLYVLLTPLFNSLYPRMSELVATGNTEKIIDLYRTGTRIFLALFFPIAITAAIFSVDLLYIWTGNEALAISTAPIVSLLIIGTALNGVMHFPYALQLAYGATRIAIVTNIILILLTVPITIILTTYYGAIGGASGWAILNLIYILLGTYLTHRSLLIELGNKWLIGDVAPPLCMAILIAGIGGQLVQSGDYSHYTKLLIGSGLAFSATILTIASSPKLISSVAHAANAMRKNPFRI